jgi:hypothetical protein
MRNEERGAGFRPHGAPGSSLSGEMRWLAANAQSGGGYAVEITADESVSPVTLSYSGKDNIKITWDF